MRISDWSSDVCSSDLRDRRQVQPRQPAAPARVRLVGQIADHRIDEGVEDEREHQREADQLRIHPQHLIVEQQQKGRKAVVLDPIGNAAEAVAHLEAQRKPRRRSEEHTSELQSLMRISYAVFCLKKKKDKCTHTINK